MSDIDPKSLKPHPAADLLPMFAEDRMRELVEDIRQNGLLDPIAIYDGQILDGRNRLAACLEAGVEPRFVTLNGDCPSPTRYVLSKNLQRRDLTHGQRSAIANEALPLFEAEAHKRMVSQLKTGKDVPLGSVEPSGESHGRRSRGRATVLVGTLVGVSRASVERARLLQQKDPEAYGQLKRGEITLGCVHDGVVKKPVAPTRGVSKKPSAKAARVDKIREMAQQGYRSSQIAEAIGIQQERVRLLARQHEIKLPDGDLGSEKRMRDVNRIIDQTVLDFAPESLQLSLDILNAHIARIDDSRVETWVERLTQARGVMDKIIRKLRGCARGK